MPNVSIKNLDAIRAGNASPAQMAEAFDSLATALNNTNAQTGADPTANQSAPPSAVASLNVSSGGGGFHVQILDNSPVSRQINYFVEYSASPGFQQPQVVPLGPSRNTYLALGNKTLYFRAYSAYPTSSASAPVYFGGSNPQPLVGGGASQGATLLPSAGSGTGSTNGTNGAAGFGPVPTRARLIDPNQ